MKLNVRHEGVTQSALLESRKYPDDVRLAERGISRILAAPTDVRHWRVTTHAVRGIAREAGSIDLVKIDTEGTEPELAAAFHQVPTQEVRYEDNRDRVVSMYPRSPT